MFLVSLFLYTLTISIPEQFTRHEHGCAWSLKPGHKLEDKIINKPPYVKPYATPLNELPNSFSWDNQNGSSLVTSVRNQGLPYNCGSCWSFATTGALSDRLKINTYRNKGIIETDIVLSVQFTLDICAEGSGLDIDCGSCNGGSSPLLLQALSKTGISDESCNPYLGISTSHWGELGYEVYMCRTCNRFGDCNYTNPNPDLIYYVQEYGTISITNLNNNNTEMTQAMMQEIYNRGPIQCLMYAHADSFENYNGGILTDNNKYNGVTHYVTLIGWGTNNNGLMYWIGRNSFGTSWGGPQKGFFMAQMGINIYNMEEECNWGTIINSKDL